LSPAKEDDEYRKRITTALMEGKDVVEIDNLTVLDSGSVASAITAPIWNDRHLGLNKNISVSVRCIWVVTGNNIQLSQEIARRCVSIRLNPPTDRPWLRSEFKHPNLMEWVHERRTDFIEAALVLIQAWI